MCGKHELEGKYEPKSFEEEIYKAFSSYYFLFLCLCNLN